MKAIKMTALVAATLASSAAMANVMTNTAGTVVDGTKTIFTTLVNPAAVSVEAGSLGYGANVAWAVNDTTELQAGWAGGNVTDLLNGDFKADGARYDISTDLSNPYLGVQMRPAANWFTVGTGVIVPDNEITAKLRQNESANITIDGVTYDATNARVEAEIKQKNKIAPYLTIGFRPNLNNNWGVFGEVGGAYMGDIEANVKVLDGTVNGDKVALNNNATFERAAEDSIENKGYAKWYPIAKLGVTYRF